MGWASRAFQTISRNCGARAWSKTGALEENSYYRLAAENHAAQLLPILETAARELSGTARDARALRVALRKRQDKARDYFNQLAGKFGRTYCPGRTWDGVAHMLFALVPKMVVADLGAGEGTLAQLLAKRAKKVIAIDNSEKMVEVGAALAKKPGSKISNIEWARSKIRRCPRAVWISRCSARLCITRAARHAPWPLRIAF